MEVTVDPWLDALVGYHVATAASPEPPLDWQRAKRYYVMAANGLFVQAATPDLAVCLQIDRSARPIPGLVTMEPGVRWRVPVTRIPGPWALGTILAEAQALGRCEGHWTVVSNGDRLDILDTATERREGHVRYESTVPGNVMIRVHSHHAYTAGWSATDDDDDTDVGVVAVIGTIFSRPTIRVRMVAWGHRQEIPAAQIFDGLGPFKEGREWTTAFPQ